jgi:hypothetical protein
MVSMCTVRFNADVRLDLGPSALAVASCVLACGWLVLAGALGAAFQARHEAARARLAFSGLRLIVPQLLDDEEEGGAAGDGSDGDSEHVGDGGLLADLGGSGLSSPAWSQPSQLRTGLRWRLDNDAPAYLLNSPRPQAL